MSTRVVKKSLTITVSRRVAKYGAILSGVCAAIISAGVLHDFIYNFIENWGSDAYWDGVSFGMFPFMMMIPLICFLIYRLKKIEVRGV